MARAFTKKPGNADSCFPQSAGTQTNNFPEVYSDNQTVAFLLDVSYCVLRARFLGMDLSVQTSIRAGRRELLLDHKRSKPVMLAESSCEVSSLASF